MSNIDKNAIRKLAVDAKELAIIKRYTKGIEAQKKFMAEMTPALVLALLDELEATEKRSITLPDYTRTYKPQFAEEIEHQVKKVLDTLGVKAITFKEALTNEKK